MMIGLITSPKFLVMLSSQYVWDNKHEAVLKWNFVFVFRVACLRLRPVCLAIYTSIECVFVHTVCRVEMEE